MSRFDVYPNTGGYGSLLDVQADLLSHLNTRVVVPLLPVDMGAKTSTTFKSMLLHEWR
nr:CcdB family protein [Desulfonatronovibrio magnus]